MSDNQVRLKMNAATDAYLSLGVDDGTTEDANPRFLLNADGDLEWGNGTDAVDTNLYRSAANTLATDDALTVGGALTSTGLLSTVAGLLIDEAPLKLTIQAVSFGAAELGGSETNTSFTFTAGSILLYAFINVADGESGTMDVGTQGTSNDPDGILDGIDLTNTGYVLPDHTITTGLNENYISATTFGALWANIQAGSDVAGDTGFVTNRPKLISAADPVSITSSGDLNSCSGTLYLVMLVPTA